MIKVAPVYTGAKRHAEPEALVAVSASGSRVNFAGPHDAQQETHRTR